MFEKINEEGLNKIKDSVILKKSPRNELREKNSTIRTGKSLLSLPIFRHFKGDYYAILDITARDIKDCTTGSQLVIYKSLKDNQIYARPIEEFASYVDFNKYPDEKQMFRFSTMEELINQGVQAGDIINEILNLLEYPQDSKKTLIMSVEEIIAKRL